VKLYSKVVMLVLLVILLSASGSAWGSLPSQDDIGTCLSQPDGSRITLPCEEIYKTGRSGRSFAIKEFCEPQPAHPRLVVVSTRSLPVSPYWTCDLSGVLSSFSGTSRNGSAINQRVLVVSPENVLIYCDQKGRPFLFSPLKGLGIEWANKRSLAELAGDSIATTSRTPAMSTDSLPPMPDALDSASAPVYCESISDAKAEYAIGERNLVELQCRPFSGATSTQFTLGQDDPADSITVHYTGSASLGTGRINKIVGTIERGSGNNYWIEVDSGPNWTDGDTVGSVQAAPEGNIAWVKTLPESGTMSSYQQNTSNPPLVEKVVSRVFSAKGYFYLQEPGRTSGIRVVNSGMAFTLNPGDTVTLYDGEVTTVDGERVVTTDSMDFVSSGTAPAALGLVNKALGGGSYNTLTVGPVDGFGLNNVGLLTRTWGKITDTGSDYFYMADLTDGGTAAGIRVLRPDGYQSYTPAVGDYVAVTGISGLATYDASHGLARTIRAASAGDLNVVQYGGPPTKVEVQATGVDANDDGKIAIYWKAAPGATGYNVYRGTTSAGEDYQNTINGSTPWNTTRYAGSSTYVFTDTGLTLGQEYFYTVKAVRAGGESVASFEDSDYADPYTVPWDSDDAYTITSYINDMYGYTPDVTRVLGPDGTLYCSQLGVLRPGGSVDLGTLQPETNLFRYSDGSGFAIPDDGNELGTEEEQSGMQPMAIQETEMNHSDGPYRRVRSVSTCTGSYGAFYPGWRNQIYMANGYPDDTYWTYLGSRSTVATSKGPIRLDIDAGLQWSRAYNKYNPYLSLKPKRPDGDILARILAPQNQPIRFDTSYFGGIEMYYLQTYPSSYGSVPILLLAGYDANFSEKTVMLAAANPIKAYTGMMKRAHSIAQGGIHRCRATGSYVQYASYDSGHLRTDTGAWITWGGGPAITADQGKYPLSPPWCVEYTIPFGQEYYAESNITIRANFTDTRRP